MRLILFILCPMYYLLYHQFAWTYDLVSAAVSLGRWNDWVRSVIPFVEGRRVLELGHGPGHLQRTLHERGLQVFGLDESRFMSRQASRRLKQSGIVPRLSRGLAQSLPFPGGTFETVASTFPGKYIFDPRTLAEIQRVLVPDGRLVILSVVWFTGKGLLERLMAWLYRITGEVPGNPRGFLAMVKGQIARAGFEVREEMVKQKGSTLLIILARKAN